MIDAKELRIGNWVMHDGKFYQATSMYVYNPVNQDQYVLIRLGEGQGVDSRYLEPIQLTEEMLLKCEFEKTKLNDYTYFFNLYPLQLLYNAANGIDYFHSQFGGKFIKVASLHQLQNLYFALTGKELEFSL